MKRHLLHSLIILCSCALYGQLIQGAIPDAGDKSTIPYASVYRDKQATVDSFSNSEFDWLLGNWQRLNDRPGRSTYEHWTKISNSEYQGLGYTLRNGDTIFKEHMKLHLDKGKWIFEVSGVNEDPTLFPVTSKTQMSFTCENKKNEFPKFIEYSLIDKKLKAKIYGGGQEVLFSFAKL